MEVILNPSQTENSLLDLDVRPPNFIVPLMPEIYYKEDLEPRSDGLTVLVFRKLKLFLAACYTGYHYVPISIIMCYQVEGEHVSCRD
ncbi:hypothetical protein [Viridibacillus arvi]|uniref:hypothetical protein n=1 Tax=Viridibacillus arvi TaxID=263475 RepID=UPI003D2B2540